MKLRENIGKPSYADTYIPQVGWYAHLNGQKLPILNFIQMSASRGVLYMRVTIAPHWNINTHDILYVTKGRGRIQVVGNQGRNVFNDELREGQMVVIPQYFQGRNVFNDELREGQMVVIPQYFTVMIQAWNVQFEWAGFLTHGNSVVSKIVDSGSFFRGLPKDVIAESYKRMSRREARILKNKVSFHQSSSQQEKGGKGEA